MEEEKPNYYAIIPANVRYDDNLKDKAKLLYSEITALSNKDGCCYASNKYFAKLYKVELETISRLISSLEENGYIERKIFYKEGTKEIEKRVITPIDKKINTYCSKNQEGYCEFNQEGIDEKVKDNITSINNTSINNNSNSSIYEFIENNFGRTLSPIEYEQISLWEDTGLTRYAIKQSVLNGKCTIKYINGILNSYKKNNIRTVQEAQNEEIAFKEKANKKNEPRKSFKEIEDEKFNKMLEEEIKKYGK